MTRDVILKELYGGLWHTTHPDRFGRILLSGAILPEPDIPDGDRWKTSRGKDYYPYVRSLGGVSLFDFDQFDSESYTERCPMSMWYEFVPFPSRWGCSVWIEIDRQQVKVMSASELRARQESEKAYCHSRMPEIEAAHLGPLPRMAFKRAFRVCKEDDEFHPLIL